MLGYSKSTIWSVHLFCIWCVLPTRTRENRRAFDKFTRQAANKAIHLQNDFILPFPARSLSQRYKKPENVIHHHLYVMWWNKHQQVSPVVVMIIPSGYRIQFSLNGTWITRNFWWNARPFIRLSLSPVPHGEKMLQSYILCCQHVLQEHLENICNLRELDKTYLKQHLHELLAFQDKWWRKLSCAHTKSYSQ